MSLSFFKIVGKTDNLYENKPLRLFIKNEFALVNPFYVFS